MKMTCLLLLRTGELVMERSDLISVSVSVIISIKVQLTHEQHRFELQWVHLDIIVTLQYIIHIIIQNMC